MSEEFEKQYREALQIVTETQRGSTAMVQRRMKIGYNRACRLMERMEDNGALGPLQHDGQREVLRKP